MNLFQSIDPLFQLNVIGGELSLLVIIHR
jgi:hypothetical protein